MDGAEEAGLAYGLFGRDLAQNGGPEASGPRHLELLVDRQGYLRARWLPEAGGGWADLGRLVAEVERLAREAPRAAPPGEHVH